MKCLLNLVHVSPDHNLNRIYVQRAKVYKTRLRVLQDFWIDGSTKGEKVSYEEVQTTQTATCEEYILREPPNVKWGDIVGLEDAKRAHQRSSCLPDIEAGSLFTRVA